MRSFFNGIVFQKIIGIVLIVLAVFEIISSYKYAKKILQNGTNNGFSLFSIIFAFIFGIILLVGGFICVFYHF